MDKEAPGVVPTFGDMDSAEVKQALLASIIESSEDAIISKTLNGIVTSWNLSAEKMFGYTAAEAIGKHISLIIPPERLEEETFIIGQIRQGKKVDHFHTIRLPKNGVPVSISLSVSPITNRSGEVIGASKIARDISEQQAMLEEKNKLYEQVRELNEKKDEFIGLASHELKTPLTSIKGYLQILSRIISDEKGQQFLHKTHQQVNKLSALVADLLDISKIEAGKLHMAIESFNIREIVDETIELISNAYPNNHIILETGIETLFINGDPNRVGQVLINFLTNAIRYAPGTGPIEVYLGNNADEVTIGVKDFGVGIPTEKLEDVFTRFYRVDETNPNVSGLGIGLYLSHQIVTRHNGRIWAESKPGTGSTFWFTLPINSLS